MFSAALAKLLAFILLRYPPAWMALFVFASLFFLYVALHKPTAGAYWALGITVCVLAVVPLLFKRHHNRIVGFLALVFGVGIAALPGEYQLDPIDTWFGVALFIGYGLYAIFTNKAGGSFDDVVGIEPPPERDKTNA